MGHKTTRFYDKNWFIILALIFMAPLGIVLMWRNNKWTRKLRIIISIVASIFFLMMIGNPDDQEISKEEKSESVQVVNNHQEGKHLANNTDEIKQKQNLNIEDHQQTTEKNEKDNVENKKESETEEKQTTSKGDLKAHFIDVEQADATLFQYEEDDDVYHILYDTGDWQRSDTVSYLNQLGIQTIDLVVITHPHADHIGQLEDIMNEFDVKEVWMDGNEASSQVYQRSLEAVLNSNATYHEPRAGQVFDIGPIKIEVLHPSSLSGDLNTDSIVTRISFDDMAFVMTGDATSTSEKQMIKQGNIEAQVLSLGHHGSNTSSTQSFLDAVDPDIAIYSAASDSQYGHPHKEVVSRVENNGIKLYGTDVHGNIIVETDGKSFDVSTTKDGEVVGKSSGNNNKDKKSNNKQKKESYSKQNGDCININEASREQLQTIIHIGPDRADDIVDLRPFQSIDGLTKVNGIGPARLDDIKDEGKACVE